MAVYSFTDLRLTPETPDNVLWRRCQQEAVVLITANRNQDGDDSLEAVIRAESRSDSLPVFTVSDAERLLLDRGYAHRVAERLLGYLLDIDAVRGTGRLYLP